MLRKHKPVKFAKHNTSGPWRKDMLIIPDIVVKNGIDDMGDIGS
jgi:hypothetical protein